MNFHPRQAHPVTPRLRTTTVSVRVALPSLRLSFMLAAAWWSASSPLAAGVPTFVGATTNLSVYRSASATDLRNLLHVSDSDSGQTLTWSQTAAPSHGSALPSSSMIAMSMP